MRVRVLSDEDKMEQFEELKAHIPKFLSKYDIPLKRGDILRGVSGARLPTGQAGLHYSESVLDDVLARLVKEKIIREVPFRGYALMHSNSTKKEINQ